jgi:hypothetical protein
LDRHSYAAIYPGIDVFRTIPFRVRWLAADIAGRCVGGYETMKSIAQAALISADGIITQDAAKGPLGALLRENTPEKPTRHRCSSHRAKLTTDISPKQSVSQLSVRNPDSLQRT